MLRKLAAVPVRYPLQASVPASTDDGRLFLTETGGPYCEPRYKDDMECPQFTPNSCRNSVETFSPGQTTFRQLFSISRSETIGPAVPNPAGTEVALGITPCLSLHGTTGLFVRDLKTGVTRVIATSFNRCDSYGPAAWNAAGTELVFPLSRAGGKPIEMAGGVACPAGHGYLALASADATDTHIELIDTPRGCQFGAAAFDGPGIVATEGCDNGEPPTEAGNNHIGYAYLLQYNTHGHLELRLPLRLGLEQSVIATVPGTSNVLVTQDQPANQGYQERDWVWAFNGHRLTPIAHYKSEDAAQVLAVPW